MIDGVWIQVYRGAIPAIAAVPAKLDELHAAGVSGVAWHGFVPELEPAFPQLEALAARHGLQALAAFGLGDAHPEVAGACIGRTATLLGCAGVLFDAEGAWEHTGDRAKAVAIGQAFRAVAPSAVAIDQPWPVPSLHGSFPFAEFARAMDAHAPQFYVNDWMRQYGPARCTRCWAWFEREWTAFERTLAPARPRFPTIQGYGWQGIFADLCRVVVEQPTLIVWCEPWPTADVVLALRVRQTMAAHGFTGAGAIERCQEWAEVVPDGVVGPLTLAALGLAP